MITVLSINLNYQAKTVENLQTIYAFEQEELTAIARLKKELCTDIDLNEKYQVKDRFIHIQLASAILIVEYDPEKKIILDYEVIR